MRSALDRATITCAGWRFTMPHKTVALCALLTATLSGCPALESRLLQPLGITAAAREDLPLQQPDDEAPPPAPASWSYRSGRRSPPGGIPLLIVGGIMTGVGVALLTGATVVGLQPEPPCPPGFIYCLGNSLKVTFLGLFGSMTAIPGIVMLGVGGYRYNNPGP